MSPRIISLFAGLFGWTFEISWNQKLLLLIYATSGANKIQMKLEGASRRKRCLNVEEINFDESDYELESMRLVDCRPW